MSTSLRATASARVCWYQNRWRSTDGFCERAGCSALEADRRFMEENGLGWIREYPDGEGLDRLPAIARESLARFADDVFHAGSPWCYEWLLGTAFVIPPVSRGRCYAMTYRELEAVRAEPLRLFSSGWYSPATWTARAGNGRTRMLLRTGRGCAKPRPSNRSRTRRRPMRAPASGRSFPNPERLAAPELLPGRSAAGGMFLRRHTLTTRCGV